MNVLETEWWTLAIPPEWWAESEEESILVGDHDGVGCIEVSTLLKESGEFDPASVKAVAVEESEQPLSWQSVTLGDFRGVQADYLEQGTAMREWYLADGPVLLFITYSCEEENRGMDDTAVDAILDTLLRVEVETS